MVWLEIAAGGEKHVFHFDKPRIALGRAPDNDLVLPHPSVADHHEVIDLEHTNDGDVLSIGAYTVVCLTSVPPAGREAELLRSLERCPHDDDLRAVYADFLEELGRLDEAEYVRLQLALGHLDVTTSGSEFLLRSTRLRQLGRGLSLHWRRLVSRPSVENCELRFEVRCPKRWSDLAPTDKPSQRYCSACNERVYYAPDIHAARQLAGSGACVAVDLTVPRSKDDLEPPTRRMMLLGAVAG